MPHKPRPSPPVVKEGRPVAVRYVDALRDLARMALQDYEHFPDDRQALEFVGMLATVAHDPAQCVRQMPGPDAFESATGRKSSFLLRERRAVVLTYAEHLLAGTVPQ